MLKNYFKIALRNIWKNKIFSAVNIIGFAIGLASCLLILLYVNNELSYELMHKNRKNIYRIAVYLGQGDSKVPFALLMPPLAPALKEEFPEVLETVRIRQKQQEITFEYDGREFTEDNFVYSEPSFFDIFSFKLLLGDQNKVLNEPFQVVISEDMSKKYFGNDYPVGKIIKDNIGTDYTISGVMHKPISNTQLDFDFIASYSSLNALGLYSDQWGQFGTDHTYALMSDSFVEEGFNEKLSELVVKYTNPGMAWMISLVLQPFKDIYFHSKMNNEFQPSGDIQQVYLFSIVTFLIMLIACLNFMNLSTARSSHRMKEVGMRKIFGSDKLQLIHQFLSESILVTIFSMILGLLIFRFLYPALNNFIGKELSVNYLNNPLTLFILLLLAVFVGLLAGLYPAFFMSGFAPLSAIRSKSGKGKTLFRKIMVITQFTIAISLIIVTVFIYKQLHFVKNQDLGFSKDNKIVLQLPRGSSAENLKLLENELMQIPGIEMMTTCFAPPGSQSALVVSATTDPEDSENPTEHLMINALACDYNYIPMFELELVDGRNFSPEIITDTQNSIILNETAVKKFGLTNPIGADIGVPLRENQESNSQVIGVLKDFHYRSLRDEIAPVALFIDDSFSSTIVVKYDPKNLKNILNAMQTSWEKIIFNSQFEYSFLEDDYDNLYRADEKMGKLFVLFSLLIIFVACLGIFGLASFLSEQRTREIGIRKVLGSTSLGVIKLLTADFTKWVIAANVLAIPIAWYATDKWLQNFAYHTSLSFWVFLFSGILTLIISLLTISFQTFRAANLNPVTTLKYE